MDGHPCVRDSVLEGGYTNQFFIKWRDSETNHILGQLNNNDLTHGELFMRLGYDKHQKKLLVCVHLPLKIRFGSTGTRDIYFVVPVRSETGLDPGLALSLDVTTACEDVEVSRQCERTGLDPTVKLCHMTLQLPKQGHVVMPAKGFKNKLSEKSRGMLLSLKSLSRSKQFDLYFPHSAELETLLKECSRALRDGTLQMPTVDYKKTYSGRNWAVDNWSAYGLHNTQTMSVAWNPLIDEPPPAYEDIDSTSRTFDRRNSGPADGSPDFEPATVPVQLTHSDSVSRVPRTTDYLLPDTDSPFPSDILREFSDVQHAHPQKRKAETRLFDEEDDAGRSKRRTRGATVPVESKAADDGTASKPATRLFAVSERSVLGNGPNRRFFDQTQWTYFENALFWLVSVWDKQPDLHTTFLPEFRTLMVSVREKDYDLFNRTRINCMITFVQRERVTTSLGPFDPNLQFRDRISYIVNFVYEHVCHGADVSILDELLALDDVAKWYEESNGVLKWRVERKEREQYRLGFTVQMGTCILLALFKNAERENAA